jgi:phosphoglycerate dehydrogenase-like enzyme
MNDFGTQSGSTGRSMKAQVIWTEWDDLNIPIEFTRLSPTSTPLDGEGLGEITYFVPPYMGGREALSPILRMPNLETVQLPNAGYDDALEFIRPGVTLCNARGVHDASTAELAVGLTIASLRGFPDFLRNQLHGEWVHEQRKSLTDSRIGIVGFGSVGRTIKENLSGFAVETVAFSRSGSDGAKQLLELDDELPNLDVVILAMPLNSESRGLFDARRLALLKDGALLVNVARGPIIDTDALIVELNSGRILAALDVTDPEPLPKDHPLWNAKGLLISPHVGGNTNAFEPRFRKLVEEQLQRLSAGQEMKNIIV